MKGPNAQLPCVDFLPKKLNMQAWKNIPWPVKEAFEEIISVFKEFKQLTFTNYNNNITSQRAVNLTQQQARTDVVQLRRELNENLAIAEQVQDEKIAEQMVHVKELLAIAEANLEQHAKKVISDRIREEVVLLRQWTTNSVRE